MSLRVAATGEFKRDRKRAGKRGKDLTKLDTILRQLANQAVLDAKHRDHKLLGDYRDHREYHIEPDWLLIYRVSEAEIVFVRTGTHSDLFE